MPAKYCYFGCKLDVPVHRFPRLGYHNEARFNLWLEVLSEETKQRGSLYITRNVVICDIHFEQKFRTVGRRLTANSYPTLNLSQQYKSLDNDSSENASIAEVMDIKTEVSHATEENLSKASSSKDAYQISEPSKIQQITELNNKPCGFYPSGNMGNYHKRKCFKCGISPKDDLGIKLYRFPKPGSTNMRRCEMWAKYCFPDQPWSSPNFQLKLYLKHTMLCNKHFKETEFINIAEKKLYKHAVPDIKENDSLATNRIIDIVKHEENEKNDYIISLEDNQHFNVKTEMNENSNEEDIDYVNEELFTAHEEAQPQEIKYKDITNVDEVPMETREIKKEFIKDDFDLFGEYVASHLRDVDDEYSIHTAKELMKNILNNARLGRYRQCL